MPSRGKKIIYHDSGPFLVLGMGLQPAASRLKSMWSLFSGGEGHIMQKA